MRDQLIRYVDLLFAGAADACDIRQEILQNTLDRYDDLVAQGKTPEAAYRLAISGIGDIREILGDDAAPPVPRSPQSDSSQPSGSGTTSTWKKVLRAIAVFLYILSIVPLIVLSELGMEVIGLCGTIAIVAAATALLIVSGGKGNAEAVPRNVHPKENLRRAVKAIIWVLGLCAYLALSIALYAWYITWIIFPLTWAVQQLVMACMDLKEVNQHEK